jgi:hypothetical protein
MSNLEKNISSEQLAQMLKEQKEKEKKEKKEKEAEEKKQQKENESDENFQVRRWNAFVRAEKILKDTDMKFFRDSVPRYFRSLTTKLIDKKNGVESFTTEIKFYPPSSLRENWIELDDELARKMFRIMVEGGETISVKNPETEQWEQHTYPARVYEKITNTLKLTDEKTYNLLRLDDKLNPNYKEDDIIKISPYMRALMSAVSGNNIEWNTAMSDWVGDKEENRVWLEKWCYGAVHADIGNSMASLPVIYGPGKNGKNALFDVVFKQLLGKECCFCSTWDVLHSNFDGFKLNKVVMFIDEVPAREDWSTFKNMTGSPDSFVKQKYGPEFNIENTIRYAVGCNNETYPLPVEDGPQMMRVSPIKTQRTSTFAENTVKILDQENYPGYCRQLLADSDNTIVVDDLTDFSVGDALLRGILFREWASRESAQQFLNYLDYTYRSTTGNYSLAPLRGRDWAEVIDEKESIINKVAQYVVSEAIETISTRELYEIYRMLQEDRSDVKMKFAGFAGRIKPIMMETGKYYFYQNPTIKDGTRVGIYCSILGKTEFRDYEIDSRKFIQEVDLYKDSGSWQKRISVLKYKEKKALDNQLRIQQLNQLINPEKD